MATCELCKRRFRVITNTHLKKEHQTDIRAYTTKFGKSGVGFATLPQGLSKQDPRYIAWRKTLLGRPAPWNKGLTKNEHPGILKISQTFKKKGIDNFADWRRRAYTDGTLIKNYPVLHKNEALAFLIGLVLGDGNINKFPRTECLRITLGTDKPQLWHYTAKIVQLVFGKKPNIRKRRDSACVDVGIYQKEISKRLGIPLGARGMVKIQLPSWIGSNKKYLIACLKGLFEAEGSFSIHKNTYTYNLSFSNTNRALLDEVENGLRRLTFHPERRSRAVRLRKKHEAFAFIKLINFRKYV